MATNEQLTQAYDSLVTAYRLEIIPRFESLKRTIDAGALYSEVASEITGLRSQFDSIYGQILSLLEQARANDPQDTALINRLETSYNVRRNQNYSVLAQAEITARENEARQVAREQADQELSANRDSGPGTSSAADQVRNAAANRSDSVSNPPVPATVLGTVGARTNAVSPTTGVPVPEPSPDKLGGATSPSTNAGSAIASGGSALSGAPGVYSLEPDNRDGASQSFIYKLVQVTHHFRQGKFTQDIEGVLVNFDDFKSNKLNVDADIQNGENFYGEDVNSAAQRQSAPTPRGRVTSGAIPGAGNINSAPDSGFFPTGEEVNFRPTSLSSVKDAVNSVNPNAAAAANPTVPGSSTPPTSGGQPVGVGTTFAERQRAASESLRRARREQMGLATDPKSAAPQVIKGDD